MDLIQSIIMTFALCAIVIFAVDKAGGWNEAIQYAKSIPGYLSLTKTPANSEGVVGSYGIITIISTLAWGLGYFGMPHILVRFMSIRDENELKLSRRIASIWVVISMGVAILIGVLGNAMNYLGAFANDKVSDSEKIINCCCRYW